MEGSRIRRVLVPLDGSPLAERAVPHAAVVAQAFGAGIVLLSVVSPERRSGQFAIDSAQWRLRRTEAAAELNRIASRLSARGLQVETELTDGKVEEEILEVSAREGFDLLALTTHGRGGPSRFPLGGTASKLLSQAELSVLLVRTGDEVGPAVAADVEYGRVMVAVDRSFRSDWALHLAAAVAQANGAELLVAHVVSPPEMPHRKPGPPVHARLCDELVRAKLEAAEEYLREVSATHAVAGLAVRTTALVAPGVLRALNDLARREGVGLVVASAHGAGGPGPWPHGGVCSGLIAHSTTHLLVFQDQPRHPLEESGSDSGAAARASGGWSS